MYRCPSAKICVKLQRIHKIPEASNCGQGVHKNVVGRDEEAAGLSWETEEECGGAAEPDREDDWDSCLSPDWWQTEPAKPVDKNLEARRPRGNGSR